MLSANGAILRLVMLQELQEAEMDYDGQIKLIDSAAKPAHADKREIAVFAVLGMTCPDCAIRIENTLAATEGVLDAHFEYLADLGVVVFDPNMITTKAITDRVGHAGDGTRHEFAAWLLAQ